MLDEQQLGTYIDEHFTSELFRLETLDRYAVDSDGADVARYLAGEPGPDPARKGAWLDVLRSEAARGLHTYRVHVLRSPLTDYLCYECEWGYQLNAQAGEHIRILDLAERPGPASLAGVGDFWLIGEDRAAVMVYDDAGHFLGGELASPQDVAQFTVVRRETWEAAVPFADYWQAHPQYHRNRPAMSIGSDR